MLKICLVFLKSEPQYAYKRYAYKRKNMYVQEKSGSGCTVGTSPLFLRHCHFFGIFGVFSRMSVLMQ